MEDEFHSPDFDLAVERSLRFTRWQKDIEDKLPEFIVSRDEVFEWVRLSDDAQKRPRPSSIPESRALSHLQHVSETHARMALQTYVLFLENELKKKK